MGVTIPDPDEVSNDLIEAVCDEYTGDADVEIVDACGRPGMLKVHDSLVHTTFDGYDVVGVGVTDEYTLVHIIEA